MISRFLFFLSLILLPLLVFGQDEEHDKPTGDLSSPREAAYQHTYYQKLANKSDKKKKSYLNKSAKALVRWNERIREEDRDLSIKLQQIYDGKGLEIREGLIPDNPDYIDSTSGNPVYVPFPKELPGVYLVRPKLKNRKARANYWKYSNETVAKIPEIHKGVYPLGSHYLLDILPKGERKFLGLEAWQYLAVLILFLLGFLVHLLFWRLINFILELFANSRLGREHFDSAIISKLSRLSSFLVVTYLFFVLVPVLRLPPSLSYYLLGSLRIFNTVLMVFLLLNCVDLARSYFERIVANTETDSDDQLLPIIIRTMKTVVVIGGILHALSIFGVDVTALVAGLSIGGLAIALAAQETVKNLIGSVMIFADKPFKLGDYIKSSDFEGTVEDIGFRSTRIRTLDTSLVTVPNGSIVDMVVDNYGELHARRFNTTIGVTYYTPPHLIEKFLEGLRELNAIHPRTNTNMSVINLSNMGGSSLDILFIVFFRTVDFMEYIQLREEMILAILKLAESMNIHIAFPSSSVYIETMPEKKGSIPDYDQVALDASNQKMQAYLEQFKQQQVNKKKNSSLDTDQANYSDMDG